MNSYRRRKEWEARLMAATFFGKVETGSEPRRWVNEAQLADLGIGVINGG